MSMDGRIKIKNEILNLKKIAIFLISFEYSLTFFFNSPYKLNNYVTDMISFSFYVNFHKS